MFIHSSRQLLGAGGRSPGGTVPARPPGCEAGQAGVRAPRLNALRPLS